MIQMEYQQKMRSCHEYVEALEEERRKIQVFQREFPLCLELVSQAIEACRRELSRSTTTEYTAGQSDCSEQTSSDGPVLEEFIPIKRSNSSDYGDDQEESTKPKTTDKKKSDWLRSVQLWNNNQSPDPAVDEDSAKNGSIMEVKRNGRAFQPFQRETAGEKSNQSKAVKSSASVPASATSSRVETGNNRGSNGSGKEEEDKEGQKTRKQRRCWSPELHRLFLHTLQELGGCHAATPKQIRELMKVDGLTNDEVKSHLQKYRLYTRRPSSAVHNNGNPQAPQFVVVGGIWVPPPAEYAAMAAPTASGGTAGVAPPSTIYTPAAAQLPKAPQPSKPMAERPKPTRYVDTGSHSEGAGRSTSPAASSSAHTTTASPSL